MDFILKPMDCGRSGGTGDGYWLPTPCPDYKMAWMIRNEDFFALR